MVNYFFIDYIYTEILKGIEEETEKSGYLLVISNSYGSYEKQYEAIVNLLDQNIDGLVIEPSYYLQTQKDHKILDLLNSLNIPIITTHREIKHGSFSSVILDDVYAGESAARYLLQKGHTRIGYILKREVQPYLDRFIGFSKVMAEAGYPLQERYCVSIEEKDRNTSSLPGYEMTKKILEENDEKPTAIFYFNDHHT